MPIGKDWTDLEKCAYAQGYNEGMVGEIERTIKYVKKRIEKRASNNLVLEELDTMLRIYEEKKDSIILI